MVNHGQCFKNSVNKEIQTFSLCPKMTQCKVLTWSMGITFCLFVCLTENENKESAQDFKNMPSGNLLYNLSCLLCQPFWVHSHPQYMNTEQAKQHSCTASNTVDILHSILNQHEKSTCSKMNKQWKHLRKHKQNLFTSEWRDLWWPGHLTKPCWFTLQRSDWGV